MRRMSFALTTKQFLDGTKDVTRRVGWAFLKPGDLVIAIEKGMGVPKGFKQKVLGVFRVISNEPEPLIEINRHTYRPKPDTGNYGQTETSREGFPEMDSLWFVKMFRKAMKVDLDTEINRIEYHKLTPQELHNAGLSVENNLLLYVCPFCEGESEQAPKHFPHNDKDDKRCAKCWEDISVYMIKGKT